MIHLYSENVLNFLFHKSLVQGCSERSVMSSNSSRAVQPGRFFISLFLSYLLI